MPDGHRNNPRVHGLRVQNQRHRPRGNFNQSSPRGRAVASQRDRVIRSRVGSFATQRERLVVVRPTVRDRGPD